MSINGDGLEGRIVGLDQAAIRPCRFIGSSIRSRMRSQKLSDIFNQAHSQKRMIFTIINFYKPWSLRRNADIFIIAINIHVQGCKVSYPRGRFVICGGLALNCQILSPSDIFTSKGSRNEDGNFGN
jgi:hypothetical protein